MTRRRPQHLGKIQTALLGSIAPVLTPACNAKTAQAVLDAGADYLLVAKANQSGLWVRSSASLPTLRQTSPQP
jgi:hypothetical protein